MCGFRLQGYKYPLLGQIPTLCILSRMAEIEPCNINTIKAAEPQASSTLDLTSTHSKDGNIVFHFKFPEDGLALRSVCVVNGIPKLRFDASPKVPTIQEGDVATIFRLVSENKRPGFFYTNFPITHPLQQSRLFMQFSPAWLRNTGIGKDLADVDWSMKCLHIGTRTNEEKTIFESWKQSSQLEGLATHLDFPKDGFGPTIMSCERAKVQKDENEMVFPEEPKMKITDGSKTLYSKYITEIYQSVAYHDEPKFLKMQELIKLILAIEWLYKEKGVQVNKEWMMKHTSKSMKADVQLELGKRKKPPNAMIPPLPPVFKRPSSDVTVKTREAEMYRTLRRDCKVEWRYGYHDFGGAEFIMFKEDGTKCPPQKCLKFGYHSAIGNSIAKLLWCYLPLPEQIQTTEISTYIRDELLALLPKSARQEITFPLPVSVDTTVDDSTDGSTMELKLTQSFRPCPPLALPPVKVTTTMTATIDNYNKLFASEDPNQPIQPNIPGVCEAIIPNVKSWDELISELTVPIPRIWQYPFTGIGEPTATGGVTTTNFPVREEPLRTKVVDEETQWKDNYKRSGHSLMVRAVDVTAKGMSAACI